MHFRNTFWKFFEDLLTVTKIKKIDSEVVFFLRWYRPSRPRCDLRAHSMWIWMSSKRIWCRTLESTFRSQPTRPSFQLRRLSTRAFRFLNWRMRASKLEDNWSNVTQGRASTCLAVSYTAETLSQKTPMPPLQVGLYLNLLNYSTVNNLGIKFSGFLKQISVNKSSL